MPISSRSIRRPVLLLLVAALFAIFIPLRADDENDPAVLKKRISQLEDKVAALEEQLAALQTQKKAEGLAAALTPAEAEKFKQFMDRLNPAERQLTETELDKMAPEQRVDAIRQIINMQPWQLEHARKRTDATRTLEDLRLLDSACDQYAILNNKPSGMHPSFGDLKNFLKSGTVLYNTDADVFGHAYGPFTVDSIPKVPPETFNALSDVADDSFWTPYK